MAREARRSGQQSVPTEVNCNINPAEIAVRTVIVLWTSPVWVMKESAAYPRWIPLAMFAENGARGADLSQGAT
jgi:hypothetical protein